MTVQLVLGETILETYTDRDRVEMLLSVNTGDYISTVGCLHCKVLRKEVLLYSLTVVIYISHIVMEERKEVESKPQQKDDEWLNTKQR